MKNLILKYFFLLTKLIESAFFTLGHGVTALCIDRV